jgi:hypothetical protein
MPLVQLRKLLNIVGKNKVNKSFLMNKVNKSLLVNKVNESL